MDPIKKPYSPGVSVGSVNVALHIGRISQQVIP